MTTDGIFQLLSHWPASLWQQRSSFQHVSCRTPVAMSCLNGLSSSTSFAFLIKQCSALLGRNLQPVFDYRNMQVIAVIRLDSITVTLRGHGENCFVSHGRWVAVKFLPLMRLNNEESKCSVCSFSNSWKYTTPSEVTAVFAMVSELETGISLCLCVWSNKNEI